MRAGYFELASGVGLDGDAVEVCEVDEAADLDAVVLVESELVAREGHLPQTLQLGQDLHQLVQVAHRQPVVGRFERLQLLGAQQQQVV